MPCSELDNSFLSSGLMTAKCSVNRTWGPLDMSQCTFQSDASLTAVAVVEVMTDSPMNVKVLSHMCTIEHCMTNEEIHLTGQFTNLIEFPYLLY